MYSTGADVIGMLLIDNWSIEELLMSYNIIGDDGIKGIVGTLMCSNRRVSILRINGCGITLTGAKYLAKLVSPWPLNLKPCIKELWLYDNPITIEGARSILISAVYGSVCEIDVVKFDWEYCEDFGVQLLTKIMEDNRMEKKVVGYLV